MDYALLVLCLFPIMFRDLVLAELDIVEKEKDSDGAAHHTEHEQRQHAQRVKHALLASISWIYRYVGIEGHEMSTPIEQDEAKRHNNIIEGLERKQLYFNALIAFGAVLAFIVAVYQGCQMSRQIEIDNRAWLAIEDATIDENFKEGASITAEFAIRNLGRTPGRIQYLAMNVIELGKVGGFPPYTNRPKVSAFRVVMIAPDAKQAGMMAHGNPPMTKEQIARLDDGGAIQIQIIVKYLDVFDKPHFTVIPFNYNRRDGLVETGIPPVVMD